jgi:hypothetical protein
MKLEFSRQIFEKKAQISSFIKIHPVGADLFHADGQTDTDITKPIVAFRNFASALEKYNDRQNMKTVLGAIVLRAISWKEERTANEVFSL